MAHLDARAYEGVQPGGDPRPARTTGRRRRPSRGPTWDSLARRGTSRSTNSRWCRLPRVRATTSPRPWVRGRTRPPFALNAGGHNAGPIDWEQTRSCSRPSGWAGRGRRHARRARVEAGVLSNRSPTPRPSMGSLTSPAPRPTSASWAMPSGAASAGWSGRYGLACNSIVAADVVLADGRSSGRSRHRARAVLGAARRQRERRRGDRAGARAVPVPKVYAGRCSGRSSGRGGPAAWRTWVERSPNRASRWAGCPAAGRPVPAGAPPRPSFVLVEAAILGARPKATRWSSRSAI